MGENAATKRVMRISWILTTHDNRAYYATNMIRRLGVDKEIVKSMGGWSSDKAIEPYLDIPLEKTSRTNWFALGSSKRMFQPHLDTMISPDCFGSSVNYGNNSTSPSSTTPTISTSTCSKNTERGPRRRGNRGRQPENRQLNAFQLSAVPTPSMSDIHDSGNISPTIMITF